jgi:UDP-2-acetamido-2-deoxy-ribo-hexuluronate aminotransferase
MEFIDLKSQYQLLREAINERIQRVLEHGQYIMGPEVAELEQGLADYTGAQHCITVASGTEALLIALMALEIRPGDEIITTPFSFIATAEVIALLGARPIFVDVDPASANLDPALIEARLSARTRAIMPVSLYGQPAEMDAINAIANRHGLAVIEDGAQSFGADYHGRKSCHLSTIGCTSFFPSKPLGCYGDGGAIFTDDASLAQAMREIRVHGQSRRYRHTRIGVGGRMDTLQCAVVLAKLAVFDEELAQRRRIAALYDSLFAQQVTTTARPAGTHGVYAQYTVLLPQREAVQQHLQAAGIPTAIHYPLPITQQVAYADLDLAPCPVATRLSQQVLSLPMGPYLAAADAARVAAEVLAAIRHSGQPALVAQIASA